MRYAIFSDVHANSSALQKVVRDARRCGAQEFVCLGDVVGYGPLPAEATAIVRSTACLTLLGNHDAAVAGLIDASAFIDIAGDAVSRHRAALSARDLAWLGANRPRASIEGAELAHGDFTAPGEFNYIDSEEAAKENFAATSAQIMFVGHTHVPEIFIVGASGTVHRLPPQDFEAEDGKRYIVNVGSVGYPRESNGACMSSYALYDTHDRSVRFRRLPFSVSSVMQRGREERPRRFPFATAAIAAIAAAALAGAALFLASDKERPGPPAEQPAARQPSAAPQSPPPAQDEKPPVLAREALAVDAGVHAVKANLEVKSARARLTITFRDSSGKTLPGGVGKDVAHVNKQGHKTPANASVAVFEVSEIPGEGTPTILRFKPEAVRRGGP